MTKIELGSYIHLKDQIHMTPKGGVLFPSGMGREEYKAFTGEDFDINEYRRKGWGKINIGGANVLMRCDGSHRVDEIIRELYADKYGESVKPVLSYMNAATAHFNVDIRDSPFQGEVRATGSLDYYHPLRILFEITTRCNLKCTHCNARAGPNTGRFIPTAEFLSLLENLSTHGTRDVELTGGEPLLHPDFLEIFNSCVEKFSQVVVATNGLLVDEELAAEFAKHTNVIFQISVDGSTAESHDKRRGVSGAFENALAASQLLVSYGVPLRIMIAIGKDNVDEVEDIIQLASELGANRIDYDLVRAVGRAKDLDISPHDTLAWRQKVDKLTSNKYKDILSFFYERKRTEYSDNCGAGTTMLTMEPEGKVRPCTYLPEDYLVGGNLFEAEDFITSFKSPMNEQFIALAFPGGDLCNGCDFFDHCKGCFTNGVLMYEGLKEKCKWGTQNKLEEWVNFKS